VKFALPRPWAFITAFATLIGVCSVTVHPFGRPKQLTHASDSDGDPKLPPNVAVIFERSCVDCHSSRTAWPWYSYVAPVSWLVERDVRRGRDHMNFSEWQKYTFQQRQKLLADVASVVKNGEMPLPQYTVIHRQARLSETDRDLVYQWARKERRRVRAESQSLASQGTATHDHLQPATGGEAMH
jgi:hypothetical protein